MEKGMVVMRKTCRVSLKAPVRPPPSSRELLEGAAGVAAGVAAEAAGAAASGSRCLGLANMTSREA